MLLLLPKCIKIFILLLLLPREPRKFPLVFSDFELVWEISRQKYFGESVSTETLTLETRSSDRESSFLCLHFALLNFVKTGKFSIGNSGRFSHVKTAELKNVKM